MKNTNKIIRRIYYRVTLRLDSPLSVGNGESYYTDSDLLYRNVAGIPEYFIPGTAIAGAFRDYLLKPEILKREDHPDEKKLNCVYGYSDGENGQMSSVFFSDVVLPIPDSGDYITTRDFVRLKQEDDSVQQILQNKQAADGGKFDMEILEPGIIGTLYIECVNRENDRISAENAVDQALQGIQNGEIRFGSKKNRGFGRFEISAVAVKSFSRDNRSEWLKFEKDLDDVHKYGEPVSFEKWVRQMADNPNSQYLTVSIPLRQVGGISIRHYSAVAGDPDFSHITSNGEPVIPGSSWAGAIRADVRTILKELGFSSAEAEKTLEQWFGCVKKSRADQNGGAANNGGGSHASNIVIEESRLAGGSFLTMTRNKIDRFTGGTVDSALYTEKAYFGGTTTLTFRIRKDNQAVQSKQYGYKVLVGMMELVVSDIENGFIAIGGETAIGRGIFRGTETEDDPWRNVNLDECRSELYLYCRQVTGGTAI